MHKDAGEDQVARRIARDKIEMVYKHLPVAVVPPIFAAALVAYMLRDELPQAQLWLWVLWVTLSYALLPSALCLYRKIKFTPEGPDSSEKSAAWGYWFALMALCTAASWGGAGFMLFVPASPIHQLFLGGMLFTSAAAVMATTFPYTLGYYAGVLPILAPITLSYLLVGELLQYAMAGVMILVFLMLGFFQRCIHQSVTRSLALRYEREALVAQLENNNREIEKISRNKLRIFAAASHDLRQPLHAQRLLLAELEHDLSEKDKFKIVACLRESMDSMGDMLNELLNISKLDSGHVDVRRRTFTARSLFQRLELSFSALVAERGLVLRFVPGRHVLYSDPALLERTLRNLIHNAISYTPQGAVMVVCRRNANMLGIQVRDSGIGIPEDQHTYIFEEYAQLDNQARARNKGMGLGLAIVTRLVRLLGHELCLCSAEGAGSIFTLRVPRATEPARPDRPMSMLVENEVSLEGLRVLVVDDDEMILTALQRLLTRFGCSVECVKDAQAAKATLASNQPVPDVVMSDYRLPGGATGLDLIAYVRELFGAAVAAVLVTGDVSPDIVRDAQAVACIVLHKPVNAEALHSLLCNLRRSSQASES